MPGTPSRTIVSGLAPAPGLPAVVHLAAGSDRGDVEGRRAGQDEVLPIGERLVVGPHDAAAEFAGGQVGKFTEVPH
jgi:hypothetical protein